MNKKKKTILMLLLFWVLLSPKFLATQVVSVDAFTPAGEDPNLNRHFWLTSRLDAPAQFVYVRDRNLAIDNNDQPHIAYGEYSLYYAWYDGISWHREIVDSDNHDAGVHATLVLDSTDNPHIVYIQRLGPDSSAVRYAYQTEKGWISQVLAVGTGISYADSPALSLDSQDRPHILYLDSNLGLEYVKWTGTQWAYETLTNETDLNYPTLVLDNADRPHIVYLAALYGLHARIKYAHLEENAWVLETIDAAIKSHSPAPSLAIDQVDNLHVIYMKDSGLMYGQRLGNEWSIQTVTNSPDIGGLSIAVANTGEPHITYYSTTKKELNYAYHSGLNWNFETGIDVAVSYFPAYYTSLVLDSENRPRVSYVNLDEGYLKYASRDTGGWSLNVIDEDGAVGELSLSVDTKNNLHVGYIHNREGIFVTPIQTILKYMQVSDDNRVIDIVDENVGWPEIATDSNDNPHISYYDVANSALKYAHLITDTWSIQIVDGPGDVGKYSSIAVDSTGNPHIGYYDSSNGDVKYAYQTGSIWITQTVESVGEIGTNISLALDDLNNPYIAYYDAEEMQLKVAHFSSGIWSFDPVETGSVYGVSLVLDSLDMPHISYLTHGLTDDLKYARRINTGWEFTTFEVVTWSDTTSLVLTSDDKPHIAYQDWHHYHHILKYIYWNGTQWIEHTPDNLWSVGYDVNLELDSNGKPYIAHRDHLNGHLKLSNLATTIHFMPIITR